MSLRLSDSGEIERMLADGWPFGERERHTLSDVRVPLGSDFESGSSDVGSTPTRGARAKSKGARVSHDSSAGVAAVVVLAAGGGTASAATPALESWDTRAPLLLALAPRVGVEPTSLDPDSKSDPRGTRTSESVCRSRSPKGQPSASIRSISPESDRRSDIAVTSHLPLARAASARYGHPVL